MKIGVPVTIWWKQIPGDVGSRILRSVHFPERFVLQTLSESDVLENRIALTREELKAVLLDWCCAPHKLPVNEFLKEVMADE